MNDNNKLLNCINILENTLIKNNNQLKKYIKKCNKLEKEKEKYEKIINKAIDFIYENSYR